MGREWPLSQPGAGFAWWRWVGFMAPVPKLMPRNEKSGQWDGSESGHVHPPRASLEHTAWKLRTAERGLQLWALTPHATTRPSYPSFCSVTWSLQENTGPPELGFSVMF